MVRMNVPRAGGPAHQGQAADRFQGPPHPGYGWSGNSEQVLFVQDKGGDENYRPTASTSLPAPSTTTRPSTRCARKPSAARASGWTRCWPASTTAIRAGIDVHLLNLKSGELKLVMQGDGFAGFVSDDDLQLRLAARPNAAGGMDYFSVTDGRVADKPTVSTGSKTSRFAPGPHRRWQDPLLDRLRAGATPTALFAEDPAAGQQAHRPRRARHSRRHLA